MQLEVAHLHFNVQPLAVYLDESFYSVASGI